MIQPYVVNIIVIKAKLVKVKQMNTNLILKETVDGYIERILKLSKGKRILLLFITY